MKKYSVNWYNPLTYILIIVAIVTMFFTSIFVDESFQRMVVSNYRDFISMNLTRPKKYTVFLGILTPTKNQKG
jgi:hypothetical protein